MDCKFELCFRDIKKKKKKIKKMMAIHQTSLSILIDDIRAWEIEYDYLKQNSIE